MKNQKLKRKLKKIKNILEKIINQKT